MKKNSYTCSQCGVFGWVGESVIVHRPACSLYVPTAKEILAEVPEEAEEPTVVDPEEAAAALVLDEPDAPAEDEPETPEDASDGAYTHAYLKSLVKADQLELLRSAGITQIGDKAIASTNEEERIQALLATQAPAK